jgi:hypothetical protein
LSTNVMRTIGGLLDTVALRLELRRRTYGLSLM